MTKTGTPAGACARAMGADKRDAKRQKMLARTSGSVRFLALRCQPVWLLAVTTRYSQAAAAKINGRTRWVARSKQDYGMLQATRNRQDPSGNGAQPTSAQRNQA